MDLVFLGTGSQHLQASEAFLKITHFGQQHRNFVLFAPLWWQQAWNPNTIITHVDHLELCASCQHPDHLDVPTSGVQLWAPCLCLPGWESPTHQLALEILTLLAGCRWSWAAVVLSACTKNFLYGINSAEKFLFTRDSAERWLCIVGLVEQNFNLQLRHSSTD